MTNHAPPRKPLILIVDDDPSLRLTMRAALEKEGFQVKDAENGKAALNAFPFLQPDIIILDVLMPEMDGFQTCREIRGLPGGDLTPILMVTGLDDMESVHMAFEAGATDFITKPLNWALLGFRVQYIIRSGKTSRSLRDSQEKLARAQSLAQLGTWDLDMKSRFFYCSSAACDLLGLKWEKDGMVGYNAFFQTVHHEDRDNVKRIVSKALEKREPFSFNCRILHPANGEHYIFCQGEVHFDEQYRSEMMTGIVQDTTKMKQAEEKIHRLAFYDELTGLPNRALFLDRVNMAITQAKRRKTLFGLLFINLDRFKRINDTLGHQTGDEMLKIIASRLHDCIREADSITRIESESKDGFVARLGGDEFVILITDLANPEDAARVARRIGESISKPLPLNGNEVHITSSMGISIYPADGTDGENLLMNADAAMYHAKKEGRNNYQFYKKSLNASSFERLRLENDILKALEQQEFCLYFQPLINVSTRLFVGGEALIRWNHPQLGMIPPAQFIPIMEETGMITRINEWVILEACGKKREWLQQGLKGFRVSVNVSGFQIARQNLAATIERALGANGLSCQDLDIELTENILLQHAEETVNLLKSLKGLGIRISIDDFGTGYSSLSYLTAFPVDAIKIDRSFVMNSTNQSKNITIIKAIIAMGHSLDLKVVAEGVETEEQFAMLRDLGCDEAQGYFFSKPVPVDTFMELLRKGGV